MADEAARSSELVNGPLHDLDVCDTHVEEEIDDTASEDSTSSQTSDVLDLIDHFEDKTSAESATSLKLDLKKLGPQRFLEEYLINQRRSIRSLLASFGVLLPPDFDDVEDMGLLQILRIYISREFNRREKLEHVNDFNDVVRLLKECQRILVITGAGISTSLGIPDFRSEGGIYSRLQKYNLTDPQEMFDIHLFRHDPSIFYDFARELLPEDRGYSATHAFIRLLQDKGKLLTQYTQNIDNIESTAGIQEDRLIQCHGSFRTASCLTCGRQVPGDSIFPEIKAGNIPRCKICSTTKKSRKDDSDEDDNSDLGVIKPDITFFGEQLKSSFKERIQIDRSRCDLVICIGTSLRVAPVAEIPNLIPASVPQININRDASHKDLTFDVELLGDNDQISTQLASACSWSAEFQSLVSEGSRPSHSFPALQG